MYKVNQCSYVTIRKISFVNRSKRSFTDDPLCAEAICGRLKLLYRKKLCMLREFTLSMEAFSGVQH